MYFMGEMALRSGSLEEGGFAFTWEWSNFPQALEGRGGQIARTFLYSAVATLVALLVAYPLAYAIATRSRRWKIVLLFAVIAPFLTTYLIRTIAWKTILADSSPIVDVLQTLALIPDDGRVLATSGAVIAGLTYNFLPFMILPIYASIERLDFGLVEAAKDLYASARQAFLRVTLPLTAPGIVAGVLLTFIPAFGDYVNAAILGGTNTAMIGNKIQSLYLVERDYPEAAALSFLMMAAVLALVLVYIRLAGTDALMGAEDERGWTMGAAARAAARAPAAGRSWLRRNALNIYTALALAYMLIPIAVIAVFSFGDTPKDRLTFIFDGFTLEYWERAFSVPGLNEALVTSLQLAALATVASTAIGTLMALALVRYRIRGRRTANLLLVLPLASPEIVIGAALLSMFIFYAIPLGFTTLLIAHIMFSISFVVVVVRSRLIGFDRNLEEAAGGPRRLASRHVSNRHPAPARSGDRRRGDAGVRALDRRLRDLELQLRDHGHLPAVRLRRGAARDPRPGQRARDDAVRPHLRGDRARDLAAATRRAPRREATRAGGGRAPRRRVRPSRSGGRGPMRRGGGSTWGHV